MGRPPVQVFDHTDKSAMPRCRQCGRQDSPHGYTTQLVTQASRLQGKLITSQARFTVCMASDCGAKLKAAHQG